MHILVDSGRFLLGVEDTTIPSRGIFRVLKIRMYGSLIDKILTLNILPHDFQNRVCHSTDHPDPCMYLPTVLIKPQSTFPYFSERLLTQSIVLNREMPLVQQLFAREKATYCLPLSLTDILPSADLGWRPPERVRLTTFIPFSTFQ